MPPIRSSASVCCTKLVAVILLFSEIMPSYSCYKEKKLVYIIIITLSSYQPSFCIKCTKLNTYMLYNVHSVSFNKYAFSARFTSL